VERWVGTIRRECLDRLLILGRRQLEHVLRIYSKHYNAARPHRALDLKPPDAPARSADAEDTAGQVLRVDRHDLLGGLIHGYNIAAA
jgi:putative transposase